MDKIDKAILNTIQSSFPLVSRPYQAIGQQIGISELEVFERIEELKRRKIIRRIGGIFDSRNLGYVSTLCAARVPESKIPQLAELTQGITEITHNYLRNHFYNMWFTVIACSERRLQQIIDTVRTVLGSDEVYSLPAKKIFKIEVRLNFNDGGLAPEAPAPTSFKQIGRKTPVTKMALTEQDKALIRLIQDNLPATLTPFASIAQELQRDEKEILDSLQKFLDGGILRRVVAILYHQKAGFISNAMGIWDVPEHRVDEVGYKIAGFAEVSHCYQRCSLPNFPYNLFTMIHGRSDAECRALMAKIAEKVNIKDYSLLFSQAELKKSSMRYFLEPYGVC